MYGGDGFWMFADPADPDYIYAEYQGGNIGRVNRKTHEARDIQPLAGLQGRKLRFNWNTPIHSQPDEKGTIYIGSQFLFRSRDHGQTLGAHLARPDARTIPRSRSRSNRAASRSTTRRPRCTRRSTRSASRRRTRTSSGSAPTTATCSSRATAGRPGPTSSATSPGLPKNSWVCWVEAGHFDAGTAYATFDRHTFGDMTPYVYRTTDFGKTWTALVAPRTAGVRGYAHVVKEDLGQPRPALPRHRVRALDLARRRRSSGRSSRAATSRPSPCATWRSSRATTISSSRTHGRGIWIIDDITPLRALTARRRSRARPRSSTASPPCSSVSDGRRLGRRRRRRSSGPNPPDDAVDHVLPEEAPHLRRPEDRSPRRRRARSSTRSRRASAAASTASDWSMRVKAAARAARRDRGLRRHRRPARPARDLHGAHDRRTSRSTRRSSSSCPTRASTHTAEDRQAQFDLAMKLLPRSSAR